MSRARARITHDEVARMVKAVQSCGLSVGQIVFNGDEVRVVIGGDIGDRLAPSIDGPKSPEDFETLDQWLAWRNSEGASAA